MKTSSVYPSILFSVLFFFAFSAVSGQTAHVRQDYKDIKDIWINIAYGDLKVGKSASGAVEVTGSYDEENVTLEMGTKGGKLTIKEKSSARSNKEKSNWTLNLPENTDLWMNIGAGEADLKDFSAELEGNIGAGRVRLAGVGGKIRLNNGTGDIEIQDSEGSFQLNSGTGNLVISQVSGAISANSGTGNIRAEKVSVTGQSSFNSGTGHVSLSLGGPVKADLGVNSGTGASELNYNGHPFDGILVMECGTEGGKISAPFSFDKEESEGQTRNRMIRKTKKFGTSGIEIHVASGTGSANVLEK